MASSSGRFVCNTLNYKFPGYVSPVQDSQAWETGAFNISWKSLDSHVFCPVALVLQMIQKMVQNHHDCTRVARDVLVLKPGGSVHKTQFKTSLVGESVDSTIQQQTLQQSSLLESSCMAFGVNHEHSKGFSEEVAKQLRSLRSTPQGESMNQGGPYLGSGVKRARCGKFPLLQV